MMKLRHPQLKLPLLALLARLTSLTQTDGADLAQLLRVDGGTRREDDSYCNCLYYHPYTICMDGTQGRAMIRGNTSTARQAAGRDRENHNQRRIRRSWPYRFVGARRFLLQL